MYGSEPNGFYSPVIRKRILNWMTNSVMGTHNQHFAPAAEDQIDSTENIMWIIKCID